MLYTNVEIRFIVVCELVKISIASIIIQDSGSLLNDEFALVP